MSTFTSIEHAQKFAAENLQSPVITFNGWRELPGYFNMYIQQYKDPIFVMVGAEDTDLDGAYRFTYAHTNRYTQYLRKTGELFVVSNIVHEAKKPE